jgi:cytochrome o ubiquinol oxidase subunit III
MSHNTTATQHKNHDTSKPTLGFWIYLMTDCILFATLFATFIVLRNNVFGGPSGAELFSLPFILTETLILLTSSFTCGLALLALHKRDTTQLIAWLAVTFALGAAFLGMELYEFRELIHEGADWQRSAFLSAYFTLVGTHGLHIFFGLVWISVLVIMIAKKGLTHKMIKSMLMFSLFWHFLDIVWIFIFTIVYLMGAA